MRKIFAYYLKDSYKIEDISAPNEMENFAVDESLFITYNNLQYWVIGIINIATRAIRLFRNKFNKRYQCFKGDD